MKFDWLHFLKLAQELFRQSRRSSYLYKEARQRSAISRAYYASFIKARNYLRDKRKVAIPGLDAHNYVITHFRNNLDPVYQKIGNDLTELRWLRNQADYDDRFKDLNFQRRKALGIAEQLVGALDKL